ncbi:MAG: hypothetical protein QM783_15800 [Phycisphaerales bacterium]
MQQRILFHRWRPCAQVALVMNAWGFRGNRQSGVPELKTDAGYLLSAFARPRRDAGPEVAVTNLDDGKVAISAVRASKSELRRLLLDNKTIDDAIGRALSDEEREHIRKGIREAVPMEQSLPAVPVSILLKPQHEYRSAAHTILKCAALFSPSLVTDACTNAIRRFARYDQGKWSDFAIEPEVHLDFHRVFSRAFGVHFNAVQICWCKALRKVVGSLWVLGRIKRSVVLASDCDTVDAALFVFEPTSGDRALQALYGEIDPALSSVPLVTIPASLPTAQSLLKDLAESYSSDAVLGSLLHEWSKLFKAGEVVTAAVIAAIKPVVAEHVCALLKALTIEPKLAEVEAAVEKHAANWQRQLVGKQGDDPAVAEAIGRSLRLLLVSFAEPS